MSERERPVLLAGDGGQRSGALSLAGIGIDDVAYVDLCSCFPSAVPDGCRRPGPSGLDRPLTVTGGLLFCGGPLNDYVTHWIASMADTLRADPGSTGLVTALGWYATKHSIGIYSTDPPLTRFDPRQAAGRGEHDPLAPGRGRARSARSPSVLVGHAPAAMAPRRSDWWPASRPTAVATWGNYPEAAERYEETAGLVTGPRHWASA